jgi:membrane protein DedA with SNARE-associated domain
MEQREDRRIPLRWLLAVVVVSTVVGYVGDIVGPKLIVDHPLLQIAINPRNRWLLLATAKTSVVPYMVVGFLRLVSTDPIAFVLGWQYGDAAVAWAEKQMGDDNGFIRRIEGWFGKVAPLVILVMPSFYWCVLAGSARMKVRTFVALNIIGTIGRLVLFRIAGAAFRSQLNDLLDLVQRYQWWLVGLSFAVIAISLLRKRDVVETPAEAAAEIQAEAEQEPLREE